MRCPRLRVLKLFKRLVMFCFLLFSIFCVFFFFKEREKTRGTMWTNGKKRRSKTREPKGAAFAGSRRTS